MSALSALQINHNQQPCVEPNSLLENLYTYYSLSQLQNMLDSTVSKAILLIWNVSEDSYYADLRTAINLVEND